MLCYDLLNGTNLASAEMASRRVLQIQKAVRKNPKSPDFTGLDYYMASALDPSGGLSTSSFETHISKIQLTAAQIMRQNRLLGEEISSDTKQKKEGNNKTKQKGDKKNQKADDDEGE